MNKHSRFSWIDSKFEEIKSGGTLTKDDMESVLLQMHAACTYADEIESVLRKWDAVLSEIGLNAHVGRTDGVEKAIAAIRELKCKASL